VEGTPAATRARRSWPKQQPRSRRRLGVCGWGGGEEGEEGWVEGVLGYGEVEEAELPDAGVGRHAPGAVADGEDVREYFVGRDVAVGF